MHRFLLALLFIIPFLSFSQNDTVVEKIKTRHCNYGGLDYRVSSINGLYAGYNYLYKELFSFRFESGICMRKAENLPEDYVGGLGKGDPQELLLSFVGMGGVILDLTGNGKFRINFQIGGGALSFRKYKDWKKIESSSAFGKVFNNNYSYNQDNFWKACFVVAPRIEIAFLPYLGIVITPVAVFNGYKNYYGVQIGIMGGKLRRK